MATGSEAANENKHETHRPDVKSPPKEEVNLVKSSEIRGAAAAHSRRCMQVARCAALSHETSQDAARADQYTGPLLMRDVGSPTLRERTDSPTPRPRRPHPSDALGDRCANGAQVRTMKTPPTRSGRQWQMHVLRSTNPGISLIRRRGISTTLCNDCHRPSEWHR